MSRLTSKLRVGTDCSGIEAPIQALKKLKIPIHHVFASEIDKHCIDSIEANYNPDIIYPDMKNRNVKEIPDIDLYICGFPCQPFSSAGLRLGTQDNRGNVFLHCLKVIKAKTPSYFVLENVKGLLHIDGGNTFKHIIKLLKTLKDYDVYWSILNTKDYGIPQNRERVYIVGVKKSIDLSFYWPEPVKKCKSLAKFIDTSDTTRDSCPALVKQMLKNIPADSVFVNTSFRQNSHINANEICPCLTTSSSSFWCVPMGRKMNPTEMLAIQGFPSSFKQVVSDSQMKKQIGNSMSVNVLVHIFKSLNL